MQHLRRICPLKQQTNNATFGSLLETQRKEGRSDMAMDTLMHMDSTGLAPPGHVYIPLLKALIKRKSLADAKQVHTHLALHHPSELTGSIGEYLVLALTKCGGLEDAHDVFSRLSSRTVLSWTAIISGYTEGCRGVDALQMYCLMQEDGVEPNEYTYVSLLKACAHTCNLQQGTQLHREIHQRGFLSNVYVRSSLINMYGKCGSLVDAENAFEESFQANSVLWNAMLSTYVEHDQGVKVLQLYWQMQHESVNVDDRTLTIILQVCANLLDVSENDHKEVHIEMGIVLEIGQAIHSEARRKGFSSILFVANTLVSMYGNLGQIVEAEHVFMSLSQRNVVSWSLMISALVEEGQGSQALLLYKQMQGEGVIPDEHMFVVVLQACESIMEEGGTSEYGQIRLLALELCEALHADAEKDNLSQSIFVANTLMSLYGKCGSIAEAERVFMSLPQRNGISWNAMLSAYLEQGQEERCLHLYRQMEMEGVEQDAWTCVIALQACSMFAEKEEISCAEKVPRMNFFESFVQALHMDARKKGFILETLVSCTFVRMYGRCGMLKNAEILFLSLCRADVKVWNALLLACLEQGQDQKVLHLYRLMQEQGVMPDHETFITAVKSCCMLAEQEESVFLDGQLVKVVALEVTKVLHFDVNNKGTATDVFYRNTMVSAYGKCGATREAEAVFEEIPSRNTVSWNAMLSAYVEMGKGLYSFSDKCMKKV